MATHEQGKVWFITGSTSGFGRALVEEVLGRGDRVVATARSPQTLAELAARFPDQLERLPLDITQPAEIERAVAAALRRFGRVDVLVNNAGYSVVGAVEETSEAELRSAMELMYFGAANLTRALLPHLRAQRSGTIVQISSMGGFMAAPGFGAYCAAKHALEGLSECLAAELAPFGVRVIIVEPGAFRTQLVGSRCRTMPPLDDYAETVGPVRASLTEAKTTQPGDPAKAARAIADAVAHPSPPLRLPLGGDAVDAIRLQLGRVARNVDRVEPVARATRFDAPQVRT